MICQAVFFLILELRGNRLILSPKYMRIAISSARLLNQIDEIRDAHVST